MKRGATREEIIRTTQELISRNGIRAVRVDEIAQTLGISKRTLYTMFADKTELVNACLGEMGRSIRRRISGYRRLRATSLQKMFRLTNEYIDSLYLVDSSFLNDVKQKLAYAEQYAEHRVVWDKELTAMMECCQRDGFILPELNAEVFAGRLVSSLYEMRINQASREELQLICRALLRGVATQEGICLIDQA